MAGGATVNFRPELAAKVMAGEKTVTRRLVSDNPRSPWWHEQCAFSVGQVFAVCPGRSKPNIGHAEVVAVDLIALDPISDDEARAEGFADAAEFWEVFNTINKDADGEAFVWRIEFEALTCIGFGDREGECGLPSDVKLNSTGLWCTRCERARRDHISGQLALLAGSFGASS